MASILSGFRIADVILQRRRPVSSAFFPTTGASAQPPWTPIAISERITSTIKITKVDFPEEAFTFLALDPKKKLLSIDIFDKASYYQENLKPIKPALGISLNLTNGQISINDPVVTGMPFALTYHYPLKGEPSSMNGYKDHIRLLLDSIEFVLFEKGGITAVSEKPNGLHESYCIEAIREIEAKLKAIS